MKILNLEIKTVNKVGVSYSVLRVFNDFDVDVLLLEVSNSVMFLKGSVKNSLHLKELKESIEKLDIVKSAYFINYFPSEERFHQLKEFLSKIEEPLVLSDEKYDVLLENLAFKKVLNRKKVTNLRNLLKHEQVFQFLEKNKKVEGIEVTMKNSKHLICNVTEYKSAHRNNKYYIWNFHTTETIQRKLNRRQQQLLNSLDDIVFKSNQIKLLIDIAKKIALSDSTVLIRGETGTGKELFARGIHEASKRAKNSLITVNCAAIPDTLLESELFGHEAGAFTGSKENGKVGLFEQADKGTLFLDEIGDLPHHLQGKILRAIEEKQIRRVGGERSIEIDVRIIAATHQPLEDLIKNKVFRLDLFYRLNVQNIHIPPLRLRTDDIPILANYFLGKISKREGKENIVLSKSALNKLMEHTWKGNVRELENLIERLVLLGHEKIILDKNIDLPEIETEALSSNYYASIKNFKEYMEKFERELFKHLSSEGKSTRELAKELKISHTSVANKLKKWNPSVK